MTQYENDRLDEGLVTSVHVLPDEYIEGTRHDTNHIAEKVLDLSTGIEQLEGVDFWQLNGLQNERITNIIVGLASARRSLNKVAELLMPPIIPDDIPEPNETVIPIGHAERTSRQDYGESIYPSGTNFLVDVPEVGQRQIEFCDKGIIIGNSKIRLGPHQLYLLTLFLQNTQQAFTRFDIVNGGYHPRQPNSFNRLTNLSMHLPALRRKLAKALTGLAYSDGPISSAYIGNHIAFTWIYPVMRLDAEADDKTSIPTRIGTEPTEDSAIDNSSETILSPDAPSQLYAEADESIYSEPETIFSLDEEVKESETPYEVERHITKTERHSTKAELLFEDDYLFINGTRVEVTALEADVLRFMVVAGQARSMKFEQLLKWLQPVHPRLSVDVLNTVIHSLNKPLRFSGTSSLVKTEYIENVDGTSQLLTLGENFSHSHLDVNGVQNLLVKFLAK